MTRLDPLTGRLIGNRTVLAYSNLCFQADLLELVFFWGMRLLVSLALNNVETNRVRVRRTLPKIETTCSLEAFRRFMITRDRKSVVPNDYQLDAQVFA